MKSHPRDAIIRTERSERRDGSGTLTLFTGQRRDSDGDKVECSEVLYGIEDVRKVERLLAPRHGHAENAA